MYSPTRRTQENKINFDAKQEIKLAYVISTEKLRT